MNRESANLPAATPQHIGIAFAGSGPEAERWQRALRAVDGVILRPAADASDDAQLTAFPGRDIAAVAFAGAVSDLSGAVRRALIARRHVLVGGPVALSATELSAIADLARARGCVVMFDTGVLCDERVAFARKMIAPSTHGGPNPMWRASYVRSLRTGPAAGETLDQAALAEVALAQALCGAMPARVMALSPVVEIETGAAAAVLATMIFENGPTLQFSVSTLEPEARQETAIVCDGRTLMLDAFDLRAPMQIMAQGRHGGPTHGGWGETVTEHPAPDASDRLSRVAATFASATQARDATQSNALEMAQAAQTWEALRTSIAAGGEMIDMKADEHRSERPALRLIAGGGRGGGRATAALRVVRPDPEPPGAA